MTDGDDCGVFVLAWELAVVEPFLRLGDDGLLERGRGLGGGIVCIYWDLG